MIPTAGNGGFDGAGRADTLVGEDAPASLAEVADSGGPRDTGTAALKDSGSLQDSAADTRSDSLPAPGEDSCPPQGQTCGFGAVCSWGEPIEVACRWYRDCYHVWMSNGRSSSVCSADLGKPGCPASPPVSGTPCSFQRLACVYPNGPDCLCVPDSNAGEPDARPDTGLPGLWRCGERQNPSNCPATAPYLYSSCFAPRSDEILFCNYACFRYMCEPSQKYWTGDVACLGMQRRAEERTGAGPADDSAIARRRRCGEVSGPWVF
jgi:hypothetical protein